MVLLKCTDGSVLAFLKILRRFRIGPPKIHKQFRIDPSQVSLDLLPPELQRRGILLTIAIMKELVLFGSVQWVGFVGI